MYTAAPAQRDKPQPNKGMTRLSKLVLSGMIAVIVWACWIAWQQGELLHKSDSDITRLNRSLADVKKMNDQYKLEITRLQDPEYIEQKVRKDFQMSRPGDMIFSAPKKQ